MSTTAWRFRGTEGADHAVLRLKQLNSQDLIDVQDVAVIRWPQYADSPTAQEHVTAPASKVSSLVSKLKKGSIESSMIEPVTTDLMPGSSALVLLSSDAVIDTVAKAFEGEPMELIRSDLSVQQQDRLWDVFGGQGTGRDQPPAG